jgi:hypothetical protein
MAYMITSDISRMIVAGQKEIFNKNFDAFPIEYPAFTTEKTATKETETYDSMGNLKAAAVKPEGDAITYGKVRQAYQTSIKNQTVANGYEVSLEATKYDLYGQVNSIKAKELARTMREYEESVAVAGINNAFATNLADGVPLCSNSKPLLEVVGVFNDTLATASTLTDPDNHKTMIQMFSAFKNHQGGPMKSYPTNGLTHFQNMMDIEEIYGSSNKANEFSNTKNVLPKIKWVYSTYMSDTNAWFMWDSKYEHIIMQWFMKTVFDNDEDKISTKNIYMNALAMYAAGTLGNIGIVGNAGA